MAGLVAWMTWAGDHPEVCLADADHPYDRPPIWRGTPSEARSLARSIADSCSPLHEELMRRVMTRGRIA